MNEELEVNHDIQTDPVEDTFEQDLSLQDYLEDKDDNI